MFFRRFFFWLLVIGSAVSALGALDACVTAWDEANEAGRAVLLSIELFLYLWPWYLAIAGVAAVAMGVAGGLRDRAARVGLTVTLGEHVLEDAVAAALPVAAGILGAWYVIVLRATVDFQNHELGSALVVALSAGTLAGMLAVWPGLYVVVRAVRARIARPVVRAAVVWTAAVSGPLAALSLVVLANLEGIGALGVVAVAGPSCALVAAGAAALIARKVTAAPSRRLKVGLAATGAALPFVALTLGFAAPDLPFVGADGQTFSRTLVLGLRAATDFDRDGSSSLFGGGDCAAFNPRISPSERDLPGDGVDQNCTGADAALLAAEEPPPWVDHPPGEGRARNLVVITIEALRADHISALGYERKTTPNIDALAARSVVFNKTYSASSATLLSLAAFWSSRPPSRVPLSTGKKKHHKIAPSATWIPELLKKAGFSTAAFLPDYEAFDPASWNTGFNRGFTTYDVSTHVDQSGGAFHGFPSAEIAAKACKWMGTSADRRFALWTHFVEPHLSYEIHPKAPKYGTGNGDLYASDVWAADDAVGVITRCLQAQGRMDDTMVIITGDHGESLGEHGHHGHYRTVFEPEVRTLGLVYVPGVSPRLSEVPVVHEDLSTTMMNLLGVREGWASLRGRNVLPALAGQPVTPTGFIVELEGFNARAHTSALVDFPYKLIWKRGATRPALYDVEADPAESVDLAGRKPDVVADMKKRLMEHVETVLPTK